MTREDIEKAALKGVEEYVNSGNLKGFRGSYCKGFMEGADWRINSVWHTMDEVQDGKRPYIVQYNEECKFAMFTKPIPVPLEQAKSVFKRWAYIKDLIPMED